MSKYKSSDLCTIKSTIKSILFQQDLQNGIDNSSQYIIDESKWKKYFKNFDEGLLQNNIKSLQEDFKNIQESGDGFIRSQYLKEALVPVEYDALFVIFSTTNEAFRQKHYRPLLEYLFQCLAEKYPVDKVKFETRIKLLLPIVKCDVLDNPMTEKQGIFDNLTKFLEYPRINQEDIYEIVTNKLNSDQFSLISYQLTPLVIKNGHLGDYYVISVSVTVNNKLENMDFFAKFTTTRSENLKKVVEAGPSKKEEFFYIQYLSTLKEHGLEKLQNFIARCYFSRQNDLLVLDNLSNMGFEGYSPNTSLNTDVIITGLKKLAALHASSLILEDILTKKNGTVITMKQIYGDYLQEIFFTDSADSVLQVSIRLALESMLYILEKFPEVYGDFTLEQLQAKMKLGWKLNFEKVKESKIYTNAICHGDMHVSNILIKSTDDKCEDIKLVDFQILRYCPLSQDVDFFIIQNTTKQIRDQHFSTFLDRYHTEISQHLTDYGLDPKKVIPKDNFLDSVNYMKSEAVFHALYYSPVLLLSPEMRKEILFKDQKKAQYYLYENRRALIDMGLQDDLYKTRIKGLIEDFIELCKKGDF